LAHLKIWISIYAIIKSEFMKIINCIVGNEDNISHYKSCTTDDYNLYMVKKTVPNGVLTPELYQLSLMMGTLSEHILDSNEYYDRCVYRDIDYNIEYQLSSLDELPTGVLYLSIDNNPYGRFDHNKTKASCRYMIGDLHDVLLMGNALHYGVFMCEHVTINDEQRSYDDAILYSFIRTTALTTKDISYGFNS